MKVYVLFSDTDYEGSEAIRVCASEEDAEARLAFLLRKKGELRFSDKKDPLWLWWRVNYKNYPSDNYHMEEWEVL
jgi:hypothetical protein